MNGITNRLIPVPHSNQCGEDEDGNPIYMDRIYGNINGNIRLVQKDGSQYTGPINKKTIICKEPAGGNFKSHVYETGDGRWFSNGGLSITKPNNLLGKKEEKEDPENNG